MKKYTKYLCLFLLTLSCIHSLSIHDVMVKDKDETHPTVPIS